MILDPFLNFANKNISVCVCVCVCVCACTHTRAHAPPTHVDISVNLLHTCLQTIHHVSSRILDKVES